MLTQLSLDIQMEIMERLPIKLLIQLRSVCKAWKSLIDSSHFIDGYRTHQSQHLVISYEVGQEVRYVCYVDDDTFPQQTFALTVPPLLQLTPIIIGSSHGLLCLTNSEKQMAVLWNPAIRKSILVAVPNVVLWPLDSVLGFGVCPDTKDPKLVKITYIDDTKRIGSIRCIPGQVMVFTLSSGEWKTPRSNQQLPRKSIQFSDYQTVIDQFSYWFAYDCIAFDGEFRLHNLIMSFDLSTEEFREIDLPDSLLKSYLSVSRVRESLVLLDYREPTNQRVCDVWMMEHGDSKAFTKLFTINAPNASVLMTLVFRESGEPIIEMKEDLDIDTTSELGVYERCLEHIKDLGICGSNYSFFGSSYTESLLLLDHDDHGHIVRCEDVKRQSSLSHSLVAAALWFEVISLISFLCCCFLTGMLAGELCYSTEKFDGILKIYVGTSISLRCD